MNKIEVAVLNESHNNPAGMMMFLAKLTQRGHNIHTMNDLMSLYNNCCEKTSKEAATRVAALPHGTIKRFTPITVAIVGASRRFLAQARTHQVGINYVSASLQYSDYTGKADFVVPYALMQYDKTHPDAHFVEGYLTACKNAMIDYQLIASATDNDTAGYVAPQGLRNILIIQANHEAWIHFIRTRSCNRNTVETQYVTLRIWEELLKTQDGPEMFRYAGPDCMYGMCREGKMSCRDSLMMFARNIEDVSTIPRNIIDSKWPLLKEDKHV